MDGRVVREVGWSVGRSITELYLDGEELDLPYEGHN